MNEKNQGISNVSFVYGGQEFHFVCQRADDHILKIMAKEKGFYEADVLEYCHSLRPHPEVVIDAGGYIGTHSVFYGKVMGAEAVVTFEPDGENFADLQKNIKENKLDGRVYALNMGAGEKEYTGSVAQSSRGNRGASTLVKNQEGDVKIIPIDHVFSEDKIKPLKGKKISLIKIDVEGMEKDVISGALQTITEHHPVIVYECHKGSKLHEILNILQPLKYTVVNCLGRSPTYIAVPCEKGGKIRNGLWLFLSYTQTIRLWLYARRLGRYMLRGG